ncbi:hypothetical protein UPYG_G00349370 [Umbra pygmaea]|uniref:SCP domain-containing protein n=1 Tax=Umbra pygmaea TaxID=75934 RepID=A0ABD0VY91_UMBPY
MKQFNWQQFLCLFICLDSYTISSGNNPLPDITDEKFINDCVRIHNDNRSSVNPPASNMLYMTWDDALAVTARAWARFCVFKHNIYLKEVSRIHPVFTSVGENIWVGAPPSTFSVSGALLAWVDEVKDYNYQSNVCQPGKICGHYTQVVWATSYKVGCAVQMCPNGIEDFSNNAGAIFVCNYATAGNYVGEKPYQEGEECSACKDAKDQCEAKLCRNIERDTQKGYSWTPDWDPALTYCGSSCISILTLRPLVLLLTFVSAFVVHRFYPSMFFYE